MLISSHALRAHEELEPLVAQHGVLLSQLLEPNLTEQQWLVQMHCWREAGWSYSRIAMKLNQLNVPTKTGAGNLITYQGVKRFSSGRWQCGNVQKVLNSRNTQDWLKQKLAA